MWQIPRVYPILDTAAIARASLSVADAAEALIEGGARILQFRHKDFWSRDIYAEAEAVARLCREAGALFVVNDRADYAAMLESALHLGQDDLSPDDARKVVGPNVAIGFSTHTPAQMGAAQNEPVDYVAYGPVFGTASKDRPGPVVGLDGLAAARVLTARPLVAIGGIALDTAPACWQAGADSVAVIGCLYSGCDKRTLRGRMSEWSRHAL